MRFTGTTEAKADAKGRVFFPAAFRKILAAAGEEQLVLARDAFQPCLVLYPWSVWNARLDEFRAGLNMWNARHRSLLRQFVRDVETVVPESNGRFLIPKRYAQMACIKQDVVFLGIDDTVEIWSPDLLQQQSMDAGEFAREIENVMGRTE
jgi:MraZ protein